VRKGEEGERTQGSELKKKKLWAGGKEKNPRFLVTNDLSHLQNDAIKISACVASGK